MLNVKKLTKIFGNKTALSEATLAVLPGEIYCLIGPNGSGKTTFIKIIAGLLQPTAGTVEIGGIDSTRDPKHAKSLIGYIPDEPAAWSSITGEEFLHIVGALYNVSEADRLSRIPQLLKIFNLEFIQQDFFEDYSRGNKQKFSILAALLHEPKLLLIDEPIVGLDPISAETAIREFQTFAKQGGSVIMVTHTLAVAERIATRIGFIEQSVLKASGTMSELRNKAGVSDNANLEEIYKALL